MRNLLLPTVFLAVLLGASVMADVASGVSLHWPWTLGVLLVGLGLGYAGSRGTAPRSRAVLLATFALAIVSLPWVEWSSRKPFLRDLYSVEPGMDRQQVESIMGRYLKGTGWPAHPLFTSPGSQRTGELEIVDSVVYRHTREGRGDSDWGLVRFQQGRVVEVTFLPD